MNQNSRLVMQHCAGEPGSGGPATAYARLKKVLGDDVGEMRQVGRGGVRTIWRYLHELRRARPKLVHVRGLGAEGFFAVIACRLARIPSIVVSIHGTHRDLKAKKTTIKRKVVICMENLTLRLAHYIVPVCYAMSRRKYLLPYQHKIIRVIPNGVPDRGVSNHSDRSFVRAKLGISDDAFVFVSVMRVCYEKGADLLLEALRLLDHQGKKLTLLLVGDGDRLEAFMTSDFRSVALHCVGKQHDVYPYLWAADAFVLPSLHENSSNALLEAMGVGLPVIVSDVGGNRDIISKIDVEAFLPTSATILADSLSSFLDKPRHHLSGAGDRARSLVLREYSLERMCEQWLGLYAEILQNKT